MVSVSLQQLGIKGTEDWFFGTMSRDRANEILLREAVGVFLIRASSSKPNGFALSIRDKDKASHFIIDATKRVAHDGYKFIIGQQSFETMAALIEHYKTNKLSDSNLTVPASKPMFRAKFDFKTDPSAQDAGENLQLKRGDIVVYIETLRGPDGMEVPAWWRVIKRRTGEIGLVPEIYLDPVTLSETESAKFQALRQLNFPFEVEVARERIPNIFDSTQLRMEPDDVVEVLRASEQPEIWFGVNQRTRKQGFFPFNYVRPRQLPSGLAPHRLTSQSFSSVATLVARGSDRSQLDSPSF